MKTSRGITGITEAHRGQRPIKALLDPYIPTGSTAFVRFNTSRQTLWETNSQRCHINWVVYDSDWEAEFCRVAEAHPQVRAELQQLLAVLDAQVDHLHAPLATHPDVPLQVHGRYSRIEILAACGIGTVS